jgi:hypothetical protein
VEPGGPCRAPVRRLGRAALNLEILSAPALSLFGLPEGAFGLASVAFNPGDTQETVRSLRQAGLAIPEPRPWLAGETFVSAKPDATLPSGGVNPQLRTRAGRPDNPHQHQRGQDLVGGTLARSATVRLFLPERAPGRQYWHFVRGSKEIIVPGKADW